MQAHVIMLPGKKISAVTLIELLIAIGISVLILAITAPLYAKNSKGQNAENEADLIAGYINRAKSFAQSTEREPGEIFTDEKQIADAYEVIIAGESKLRIARLCKDNAGTYDFCSRRYISEDLDLVNSRVSQYASTLRVAFASPTGTLLENTNFGPNSLTVTLIKDVSKQKKISILKPGTVNVE